MINGYRTHPDLSGFQCDFFILFSEDIFDLFGSETSLILKKVVGNQDTLF
jgi:hypothetical protein